MGSIKGPARMLVAGWLLACCAGAGAQAPAEVGERNAAAGFMLSSLATLAMLRDECDLLTGPGPDGAAAVARGWWDRNRADLEVAYVWTDRYLQSLRATDPARHEAASRAVGTDTAKAVGRNAAGFFRGELPTAQSCQAALKLFTAPPPDERIAAYKATLRRIRAEADYAVPPHVKLDPERALHYEMSASLQVAQAATKRRDAAGMRTAYASMAERGDGRAAYQLGAMHLRGDLVEKSDAQAYLWFHKAWRLRETEGLTALAMMHRDARVGPAQPLLALALLQLAASQATTKLAKTRAELHLVTLSRRMPPAEQDFAACMRLRQIAAGVDRPLPEAERGRTPLPSTDLDRRLADYLPAFGGVPIACPR